MKMRSHKELVLKIKKKPQEYDIHLLNNFELPLKSEHPLLCDL